MKIHAHSSYIKVPDLEKLFQAMSLKMDKKITDKIADFSFPKDRIVTFTSLNWKQLKSLREVMSSLRMSSKGFRFFQFNLGFF